MYRCPQSLVEDIQRVLSSSRPGFRHSPLEEVLDLLSQGRHYSWAGIYLTFEKNASPALLETAMDPTQVAVPGTRRKIMVAMKIAGREIGHLNVESDRDSAFGAEDRVLLERVAALLARFLTGPGKYLVRKVVRSAPAPRAAAA